jgi:hypothetical protein
MVRTARDLVLALLLTTAAAGTSLGQEMAPARFGQPFALQPGAPIPAPAVAPPACAAYEDRNGPLLVGDPLLDGSGGTANLGWIGSFELDVLKPNVHARLNAPVPLSNGTTANVALPFAGQDWTAMPRFELGYRFGQGAGEVLFSYRFLLDSGSDSTPKFDALGPGTLNSTINLHIFDLDWASHESSLGPNWDMKWRVGARMTNIYTESVASGGFMRQRFESFFMGAGPHLGLDLRRKLGVPGLSLFARIDNSYPIGPLTQTYEQANVLGVVGNTRLVTPGPITTLGGQAGLDYQYGEHMTFTAGYTQERFMDLATFFGTNRSQTIVLSGIFLRAQWKY